MENNTVIAVEVLNGSKKGLAAIEEGGGAHLFKEDGHLYLFPAGKEAQDILEDNGFELGDETKLELVYFDQDNKKIYKAPELNKQVNDRSGIMLDSQFQFGLDELFFISDFINEHPEVAEEEIKSLGLAQGSSDNKDVVPDETKQVESDSESTDDFEDFDDFSEGSVASTNDDFEDFDDEDLDEPTEDEIDFGDVDNDEVDEEIEQNYQSSISKLQQKVAVEYKKDDVVEDDDNPLMTRAKKIFETKSVAELPEFDRKTHDNLQNDILQAESNVTSAKNKAVSAIYNQLVDNYTKGLETVSNDELKSAEATHKETLNKIEAQKAAKIQSISETKRKDYEGKREDFVQAQLPDLRSKYDQDHLGELNELISIESDKAQEESEKLRKEEISNFDNYVKQTKKALLERVSDDQLDVDGIVKDYEKVVDEQSESLKEKASRIEAENEALKQQMAEMEKELADKKKFDEEWKKAEYAKMESQLSSQINKAESEKIEAQNALREEQVKALTLAQTPQEVKAAPVQKQGLNKWASMAIGFAAALLLVVAGFFMYNLGNANGKSNQAVAISSQAPSNVKETSESSSVWKQGDTFPFTTSDGKKVTVIVDDSHTGHYIDEKGTNHTVMF